MRLGEQLAALYLLHDPMSHAKMLRLGARYKYHKVHHVPTADDLAAHLAGEQTLAVPLIGSSGLSWHIALDIDHGGCNALQRALAAAQAQGWCAYALSSITTEHDGGHLWLHLDAPVAPERARLLAHAIAQEAQLGDVEVYPTHKALRLPLGLHRWTQQRGTVLLQDGLTIDLDHAPQAAQHALHIIAALPQNDARRLPALPVMPRHAVGRTARQARSDAPENPIQVYNHTTHLIAFLEGYGARVAERYGNGGALLHCPCGQHRNGDAQPSLEVQPARNTTRYGQYVAVGHAPSCRFYTERHQVIDAFKVFCFLEDLTPAEALEHLREQEVR